MKQILMLACMCILCLFTVTGCAETGTDEPDTGTIAELTEAAEETQDTTTQTTQTETTTTTEATTTETTTETTTTTVQTTVATEATEPPATQPVQTDSPRSPLITSDGYYILNTSKLTIHRPDCSAIHTMNEENKQEYYGTVEELEAQGYHCCGKCHPR